MKIDMNRNIEILPATPDDVPLLLRMIKELAEYERLSDRVSATESTLRAGLFGPRPFAEAVIARVADEAVGFAVFFASFSTFSATSGLYLEDLFVEPEWRGRSVGRQLLAHVAAIAVARGCSRLNWSVLRWNELAIRFYLGIDAEPVKDWMGFSLSGDALNTLAKEGSSEASSIGS